MTGRALGSVLLLASIPSGFVQAPDPPDRFAVASIRANRSGGVFTAATTPRIAVQPGGRVTARNSSVREMVVIAYGLLTYQVVGGPGWLDEDRFDVEARAERDLSPDDARAMLRTLLADRFALTARTESRNLPIYALLVEREDRRLGPQLRRTGAECVPPVPPTGFPPIPPPPPPPPGQQMTLLNRQWARRCPMLVAPGFLSARDMPMDELAMRLLNFAGRPVVDETGLTDRYDFELQFTPEFLPSGAGGPAAAAGPSLFTAVREQLGLRLESRRGPVNVLVVNRVERPSEN